MEATSDYHPHQEVAGLFGGLAAAAAAAFEALVET